MFMLEESVLEGYVEETGMQNIWQVERDYLQHIILRAIYSKVSKGMVFKGGTALQKLGIVDRFSIDLDFTSSLSDEELRGIAGYVSKYLSDIGIRNEYSIVGTGESTKHMDVVFRIEGPHFIKTKAENAKATIKLQISRREEVMLGSNAERIIPIYKDIPPYVVSVMHMEEVAAEKVRAIMTRDKPRDVYDLSLLIKKGYPLHELLIRKKLEGYAEFSMGGFEKAIEDKRDSWSIELRNLLYKHTMQKGLPDFDDAKASILGFFEKNIAITAEFSPSKNEVRKEEVTQISADKLTALGDNAKILGKSIYLPFDAKADVFFYAKQDHAYLEIYEDENRLIELPGSTAFPISSRSLGLNIIARKGKSMHFNLSIEKEADRPSRIYVAILLKKI
jgi:predicted nucleotidyltransferase component of viral defense system